MRDSKRIKRILNKIEKLWNKYPDQRLGQLLGNYIFTETRYDLSMWNLEDDETEKRLDDLNSSSVIEPSEPWPRD